MSTLYIDVFFFINFTVDILASLFAVRFSNIKTSVRRLVVCALIGAICAIVDLFLPSSILLRLVNCLLFLILICMCVAKRIAAIRRIKFAVSFFLSELIIGGAVYFAYLVLERYFGEYLEDNKTGNENREALIFSIIILLMIGVFKLLVMLFSGSQSERTVKIRIEVEGKSVETEALIDTGNLVKDPMNMNPVLFIKPSLATRIFPKNITELTAIDNLELSYQKRIRLIPVSRGDSTHVMTGVRVDKVFMLNKAQSELFITVAIDKEGGSYGGFEALMPSCAIENVL